LFHVAQSLDLLIIFAMYLSTTVINFPFLLLSSAAAELLGYVSNGSSYADPLNR